MVRPEDMRVWSASEIAPPGEEMFAGTVEEVIYKGTTVDLIVRMSPNKCISACEFFDEDNEKLEYTIGQQVRVTWLAGWEVLLPA
jgi:spermidine/putrescine transport system ATP-binding protein